MSKFRSSGDEPASRFQQWIQNAMFLVLFSMIAWLGSQLFAKVDKTPDLIDKKIERHLTRPHPGSAIQIDVDRLGEQIQRNSEKLDKILERVNQR